MKAPYAPGTIDDIGIDMYERMAADKGYGVDRGDFVLALDGERDIMVSKGDGTSVALDLNGPKVLNISVALEKAVSKGIFKRG